MELSKVNIHIIGGSGQMGSWLKKFLESQDLNPTSSDENSKNDEAVKSADIIFLSVPIGVVTKVIAETVKKVKPTVLLVDLTSIKSESAKVLGKIKNPSIGLHFLFGPTVSTIQNQKIAYVPIKENNLAKELIQLFKKAGAQVLEMEVRDHDYQMAHIQALTHFTNLSLAKALIDNQISLSGHVSTPVFLAQMSATSRVISQNPKLIAQIQTINPYFLEIAKIMQKNQTELIDLIEKKDETGLESLYRQINSSLESTLPQKRNGYITDQKLKNLKIKDKFSLAYLGPEGTFSHQVASQVITKKTGLVPCKTIYDIFNSVATQRTDFGIVPAENSIEGTIRETLDFLVEFGLKVNLEMSLEVHQNLLSKEKDISKITRIISHPQAIAQSRSWLEKNLPNTTIEYANSTLAAIDETKKSGVAVIGSNLAAKIYKLNILAKDIEDKDLNITKFYIVSKDLFSLIKKPSKTLIFLTVFNRVGILRDILTVFADFDINLNKLESRPSREKNWDYNFYVEVETGSDEARLISALNILKQFCPRIEILGEY